MVQSLLLGLLATLVYASFAEWFVHRVGMHTEYLSKWAFRRHAIQHHAQRRSVKTFYAGEHDPEPYVIWDSSSVPLLWVAHFPLYWVVWTFVNPAASVGVAIGAGMYVAAYEWMHFMIHHPRHYWFQRSRLWEWYCEYHRLHHHRARWNYNVVCPLADWVLGTISMEPLPPEPSAPEGMPRRTGPASVFARQVPENVPGD